MTWTLHFYVGDTQDYLCTYSISTFESSSFINLYVVGKEVALTWRLLNNKNYANTMITRKLLLLSLFLLLMQWKILIEGKSLCRFYLVLLMIGLSVVIALLIYVLLQCKMCIIIAVTTYILCQQLSI